MFKKGLALVLILTLAITAGLVGCGPKQEAQAPQSGEQAQQPAPSAEPQVLRWNLGADPKTLDPGLNAANDGGHVINNTFEGLMRDYGNGKYEPAMAESYTISDDGTVYTFKIRDAKWSDGQPVTAHDFEYAWKRVLDPNLVPEPSEYSFQLFVIKGAEAYFNGEVGIEEVGIKAIDDKTLEVTLLAPTEYFLELTGFYTYMPVRKDIVEKDPENWAKNPATAVCNGPFKLAEYTMGDRVVLEKNDNYWQADKVNIARIEAPMIVEDSTALTAYESGDLDVLHNVPLQEVERLKKDDPTFSIRPKVGTYYYNFNLEKKPFDDVRVRKALTLAIDRKAITERVTRSGEVPATGFTPPGLHDSEGKDFRATNGDFGIDPNAAKVEEAKALLAEAGFPDGKGFPEFELLYNTSEAHKAIAEAVQEMWRVNLGINCKLQNQEWAVFQTTRREGNYQVARGGWIGDYADPLTMLDLFISSSPLNDPNFNNKEFDQLIAESKRTVGKERFDKLYKAEQIMMDNCIVAPVYHYVDRLMISDKTKGIDMVGMGHWWFGFASVEK